MSDNAAINRIKDVLMPDYYFNYYNDISKKTFDIFEKAATAKATLVDSSAIVEPKIAFDLADRVAKMHDIDIAEPLRELLKTNGKELSALILSKEIAFGKYLPSTSTLNERLDLAVRVGLAIVTEGVTIAPLQGISKVTIKKNKDGSEYLSVSIAGPMRSAGGTESAVTMLIADHVRKTAGLSKYQANSFDDETGRFVEELRVYEREAQGSFQFHVLDEDITTVISNLPVELDGVETDPYEVVNHRNMERIDTDRVRGGALRVLNDGLIGRSKKLLKRIELYNLDGWEWLNDLKGAIQTGDREDAATKRMREVITGRSVLSMPNKVGGFRLRYGRACNSGFAAVGIHPVVGEILDHTITVGTQIKLDYPSKGATIAFVDSIDTPIVLLNNGNVIKIKDTLHGIKIKNQIKKIIHLGDILISFGDFLENNAQREKLSRFEPKSHENSHSKFLTITPTFDEAITLSLDFLIPLHPKFLYFWDLISIQELKQLLHPLEIGESSIRYSKNIKPILEKIGVPHENSTDSILLNEPEAKIFYNLLLRKPFKLNESKSVIENISETSEIKIKPKFSTSVGVRIGRQHLLE
jgi:DNA polymerase II large subunit